MSKETIAREQFIPDAYGMAGRPSMSRASVFTRGRFNNKEYIKILEAQMKEDKETIENLKKEIAKKDEIIENVYASTSGNREDRIINYICMFYGVNREGVMSVSRRGQFPFVRHVIKYLFYTSLGMPLTAIAEKFGKKEHSTIINSRDVIIDKMYIDKKIAKDIERHINWINNNFK